MSDILAENENCRNKYSISKGYIGGWYIVNQDKFFSRGFLESFGNMLGFTFRSSGRNEKWNHGESRGLRVELLYILTQEDEELDEGDESITEDTGVWRYYLKEDINDISGFVVPITSINMLSTF